MNTFLSWLSLVFLQLVGLFWIAARTITGEAILGVYLLLPFFIVVAMLAGVVQLKLVALLVKWGKKMRQRKSSGGANAAVYSILGLIVVVASYMLLTVQRPLEEADGGPFGRALLFFVVGLTTLAMLYGYWQGMQKTSQK